MLAALVKKCETKQTFCVTGKDIKIQKIFFKRVFFFEESTKMKTKREMK